MLCVFSIFIQLTPLSLPLQLQHTFGHWCMVVMSLVSIFSRTASTFFVTSFNFLLSIPLSDGNLSLSFCNISSNFLITSTSSGLSSHPSTIFSFRLCVFCSFNWGSVLTSSCSLLSVSSFSSQLTSILSFFNQSSYFFQF